MRYPPRRPRLSPRPGGILHPVALAALLGPAIALSVASAAGAAQDRRIDPETGRDRRTWLPDRPFDHERMVLQIDIPDLAQPRFTAVQTLTLAPVAEPQTVLTLDAGPALSIESVEIDGRAASFQHDREAHRLRIELGRAVKPGQKIQVRTRYTADRPGTRGAGMVFSADDAATPEFDPMLHTQGQPQGNHLWFPCHDSPNERLATELIVTVPAPFEAVSNGRLVSVRRDGTAVGRVTSHWRQDAPHPAYLVVLAVGRFEVINVGGADTPYPGLWMPVYAPLGAGEAARATFAGTPDMLRFFETRFGLAYPWDKLAQILCRDFAAGGMENTSAITYSSAVASARPELMERLIAHEIAHAWFGNLVTCRSWEHAWLNEGFATLAEALWFEHSRGRDAYRAAMDECFHSATRHRATRTALDRPMVSNRYAIPMHQFTGRDSAYHKGAAILHMLRRRLGDETFFAGVKLYLERHRFSEVETDDLRLALEQVSGESLERFFDQWCRRPGIPSLALDFEWTPAAEGSEAGELLVRLSQLQRIDADLPAYELDLPLRVRLPDAAGGAEQWLRIGADQRTAEAVFPLPHRPVAIEIDPDQTVLCRATVRTPLAPAPEPAAQQPTPP